MFAKKCAHSYQGIIAVKTRIRNGAFVFDKCNIKYKVNLTAKLAINNIGHRRFNHADPSYIRNLKHRIKDDADINYNLKEEMKMG